MKLKRLLKNINEIEVRGSKEIEITGLSSNSKTVVPGNLFIAKKGLTVDGSQFIEEAIEAGASVVLTDMYNPFLKKDVVQVLSKNVGALEGLLAAEFYQNPSHDLFMVGITGTSGKTTTTYLVRHMLQSLLGSTGLISTVECIIGKQYLPSAMTTHDVITNYKLLCEMKEHDCKAAVMEVSSHSLSQGRVSYIDFDVAVFTNLSQDHLDYHTDMEDYARAKAKLFSFLNPSQKAVINADSPWSELMVKDCKAPIIRCGIDNDADLKATHLDLRENASKFTVEYKDEKIPFTAALIGRFNVYNYLAAIAVGLAKGFALKKILHSFSSFTDVPGRLQKIPNAKGLHIFVDYSHKPDALENVLMTLQQIKKGRLICLFGCGGNRDAAKRPMMGKIAERLSDEVIITSDNPRSEDPLSIIEQILHGITRPSHVLIEPDRKAAIEKAVSRMNKEDILLIAGKGHETYQIFSHGTVDFDDRLVAQQSCR